MEDKWKGYCIDLIEKLSIEMNFKYELVIKDQFGELDPVTNQWNGLIGGLVNGVSKRAFINVYCLCRHIAMSYDFRAFISSCDFCRNWILL